jgi:RND family efflux transporter MFP subunit
MNVQHHTTRDRLQRPWPALLVLLPCILFASCEEKLPYRPPPPKVTVQQPVKREVTDYLECTGNTQAINTVQLRARVEGYLEKILFQDGDRVKKGQLLFLIQQNTYQARLKQAEAAVLSQKAQLAHAQTEFFRFSDLARKKAASQTDADQWQYERDAAQAGVLSAEAARDLAKLDLEYTSVMAPFDGRIDRRLVDPGNLVGSGTSTALASINQIDQIYAYFTVDENALPQLEKLLGPLSEKKKKQKWPVELGLANEKDYPHSGVIDFTAITVTPTTGTLLMRGIFSNPDGAIMPGLFARVRVPKGPRRAALLVPQEALGFDLRGSNVMVVNEKHDVERRGVMVGAQVENYRVIEKGLSGSEWVVVEGVLKAVPGREVIPEKKTPAASAQAERGSAQRAGGPDGSAAP